MPSSLLRFNFDTFIYACQTGRTTVIRLRGGDEVQPQREIAIALTSPYIYLVVFILAFLDFILDGVIPFPPDLGPEIEVNQLSLPSIRHSQLHWIRLTSPFSGVHSPFVSR